MDNVFENLDDIELTESQIRACASWQKNRQRAAEMFREAFGIEDDVELTEELIMQERERDPISFHNLVCASPVRDDLKYYIEDLLDKPYNKNYAKFLQMKGR